MQETNVFYTAVSGIPTPVVTAIELHRQTKSDIPYWEWVVRMIKKHRLMIGRDYFQSLARVVSQTDGQKTFSTLQTITFTLDSTRKIQADTQGVKQ